MTRRAWLLVGMALALVMILAVVAGIAVAQAPPTAPGMVQVVNGDPTWATTGGEVIPRLLLTVPTTPPTYTPHGQIAPYIPPASPPVRLPARPPVVFWPPAVPPAVVPTAP